MREPATQHLGTGARVDLAPDGGVSVRGNQQDRLNEVARVARALWRLTHLTVPATTRADGPGTIGFSADMTIAGPADQP